MTPCTPQTNEALPDEADIRKTTTSHDGALTSIEQQVNAVEVSMSMDAVLEAHNALDFLSTRIREMRKSMDARLIEWIEANGPITFGTRRMYVGTKKDTKVVELAPAVEALMNDCGGDFEMFCRCLSVNAIKHGAAKTVMKPENFNKHFQTITKTELREGVETPAKQLVEVDEAFMPRNKR